MLAWGAYAISVAGLLTSFLALFVATSRIMVAMGRASLLPSALGRLADDGHPRGALTFTVVTVVTVVLGALGPGALIWPQEYLILVAWIVLGAVLYVVAGRRDDGTGLAALLGEEDAPVVRD